MPALAALAMALAGCTFDRAGLSDDPRPTTDAALDAALLDGANRTEGVSGDRRGEGACDSCAEGVAKDLGGVDFTAVDGEDSDFASDAVPDAVLEDLAPDVLAPDVLAPDVLAPDVLAPDSSPPVACDDKYGSVPEYRWCSDTPTSCTFYFDASGSASCEQMCALGGGTCLSAKADVNNTCSGGEISCSSAQGDSICTCTR